MKNKPKSSKKLTPAQIVVVLIIAIIGIYQYGLFDFTQEQPSSTPTNNTSASTISTAQPLEESTQAPTTGGASILPTGDFDYFVLALSWSPDYCATDGQNDSQQCSTGRKLSFVLHGLWPQYQKGYPSSCTNEKLTAETKAQFPGLFPSDKLFSHEWEKHGTCTGLTSKEYFTLSRQIKDSVVIPASYRAPQTTFRTTVDKLRDDFTSANPGFTANSLAPYCSGSGRSLKEVYICFTKEAQPTTCGADVLQQSKRSCQSADFQVRNIR